MIWSLRQEEDEVWYMDLGGGGSAYPISTVHALITDVWSGIKGTCLSADGILMIGR
jgi:hypothetical protein